MMRLSPPLAPLKPAVSPASPTLPLPLALTVPPLTVAAGRVFIGFLTLYIAILLIPKLGRPASAEGGKQPWGLYCGIALVEAILPCFLVPWGQQHVDSSIAAILLVRLIGWRAVALWRAIGTVALYIAGQSQNAHRIAHRRRVM